MLYDGAYMTDNEFLSNFCMDRACILQLNSLVEDHEAFSNYKGMQNKHPSMLHVMVLLKYLGSYGNEGSFKIGHTMGVSKRAMNERVMRWCSAILRLQKKVIKWQDEEERRAISAWIKHAHGFVNCVCLIDGKLFPLAFAPTQNLEDYLTRKGYYVIKGLFICDDTAKITWIEMGFSVHDNRVWSNSDVYLSKEKYFRNKEFLLGNSEFSASSVMVPAFKKVPNANLSEARTYFNTKLAKVWIKSKHCIGLLKAQFQYFQGHRWVIQRKRDLDVILQMTMCACIIHNLLIDHAIPQDWMVDSMELEEEEDAEHDSGADISIYAGNALGIKLHY